MKRALTLALVLGACGVDEVGRAPPADALYFPVGLSAHPDGRYLYIANAGFDRRYVRGTVTVYDTFERRILPEATVETGLFAGELLVARLARPQFIAARQVDAGVDGTSQIRIDLRNVGTGPAREVLVVVHLGGSARTSTVSAPGVVVGTDVRFRFADVAARGEGATRSATLVVTGQAEDVGFSVVVDGVDSKTLESTGDLDLDGVDDEVDDCPLVSDPEQGDVDEQGIGEVCAAPVRGFVATRDDNRLVSFTIDALAGDSPQHIDCSQRVDRRCDAPSAVERFAGISRQPLVASDPYGLALTRDGLLLSHIDRGEISRWVFDDDLQPVGECKLKLDGGASSVARHPLLDWAYVTDRFGQVVQAVEPLNPLDRGELGVTTREGCRLEARTPILVDALTTRGRTRGLGFSADGTLLYVASSSDASLRVYDTSVGPRGRPQQRLVATIPLGAGPNIVRPIGLRPGESRADDAWRGGTVAAAQDQKGEGLVYVTAFDDDQLVVVDPTTLSVAARIDVGGGPHDVVVLPDADGRLRAYVTLFRDHAIAVVDVEPGSSTRFTHLATVR